MVVNLVKQSSGAAALCIDLATLLHPVTRHASLSWSLIPGKDMKRVLAKKNKVDSTPLTVSDATLTRFPVDVPGVSESTSRSTCRRQQEFTNNSDDSCS